MFQYVTSLFASNTKKPNTVIYVATTRTKKVSRSSVYFKGFSSEKNSEQVEYFEEEDTSSTQLQEEISSTQLRRQNKQQKLIQKLLQGKISYQEIMNNYDQPRSQVQEDLEDDDISSTQSQRQKKQQELIQRILQRKISYQEIMNNYAQPLSRVQENLEDDDISSIQLQRQEKQQELIQKLLLGEVSYQTIVNNYAQDQENCAKDYDVWDDELIGHLMNLIDTVGIETN